jgi:hypothetical protein
MKIDKLKEAIRHIIKEEVKKAVADEVNKAMGKVLVEMVKEIKSSDKPKLTEVMEDFPSTQITPAQEVIHTKNPKLNSVLSETARFGRNFPKPETSGLAELMGGGFDKIGTNENAEVTKPASNMDFLKQMVGNSGTPNVPAAPTTPSVLDFQDELPDSLKGVFKMDFRSKMKKIEEAKKSGGSGLISASQILTG